jgi:hypothetical protein
MREKYCGVDSGYGFDYNTSVTLAFYVLVLLSLSALVHVLGVVPFVLLRFNRAFCAFEILVKN